MRAIFMLALMGALSMGGAMAENFQMSSPQIREGASIPIEQVFNLYDCHGDNLSPALQWQNPPQGSRSFAVTVYDLDVPTGGDWWHWVIFNIPAGVAGLVKGAGDPQAHLAPAGAIQLHNDFGKPGYGGPCPPVGDKPHRYAFTVYALRLDKLTFDEKAPAATVAYELRQNMLAKAVLTATYSR